MLQEFLFMKLESIILFKYIYMIFNRSISMHLYGNGEFSY